MNLTKITSWNKIASQSLISILTGGFFLLPLAKNIKRWFFSYKKELLIVTIAVAVSAGAGLGAFAYLEKDIIIHDSGKVIACKTMKNTVKETLDQNGITVNTCDYINTALDTSLQRMKTNEIYIKRAVPVYITADGIRTKVMTYRDTVQEMLKDSPVKPEGLDKLVGAALKDNVSSDMSLRIIRVNENVVSEKEVIPFAVQKRANSRLDSGTEKVVEAGQEGIREKQYKVVTEDGNEVSRLLMAESVLRDPINMILEFGTVLNYKTSRGDTVRYKKVMDMRATAYTASFEDTGKRPGDKNFGITATGIRAKKGVIAVDPRVIPLHTRVYVEIAGSTPDYGYAVAEDVGGAIKGNKIDLYYDSLDYVRKFGVKRVKVYILQAD
jgi:uncharacterized protein YabE (DUF348 family)